MTYEMVSTCFGTFKTRKNDLITTQLKKFGAHTRKELAMVMSEINEGDIVLDIGAHIGTFCIPFTQKNPLKIYAIEANEETNKILNENIDLNNVSDTIIPIWAVASDKKTNYKKELPKNGNSGMYQFIETKEQTEIPVVIPDDYIKEKVNFIKIDVEGSELSVLKSCESIIKECHPKMYIECNKAALEKFGTTIQDIEEFLLKHDYKFYRNSMKRNGKDDKFNMISIESLSNQGAFFDVLVK